MNFLNRFSKKKKNSNDKSHQNPSSGSRVVPCGGTDRWTEVHDEANSQFFSILRTRLKSVQCNGLCCFKFCSAVSHSIRNVIKIHYVRQYTCMTECYKCAVFSSLITACCLAEFQADYKILMRPVFLTSIYVNSRSPELSFKHLIPLSATAPKTSLLQGQKRGRPNDFLFCNINTAFQLWL